MSDSVSKITRDKELRCNLSHPSVDPEMPVLTSIDSHLSKDEIRKRLSHNVLQKKGGWEKDKNFQRYLIAKKMKKSVRVRAKSKDSIRYENCMTVFIIVYNL